MPFYMTQTLTIVKDLKICYMLPYLLKIVNNTYSDQDCENNLQQKSN